MDELMKAVYRSLGFNPNAIERAEKPKCRHGNPTNDICLSCEKEEERRQDFLEMQAEYRRMKDGE